MLPPAHRLRTGEDFRHTVRGGRKVGTRTLVAHLGAGDASMARSDDTPERGGREPRVGMVVSRSVGNAVIRNRVKRRLRHLARARLEALPADAVLVVRALPPAGTASSEELARDLDRALDRALVRPAGRSGATGGGA